MRGAKMRVRSVRGITVAILVGLGFPHFVLFIALALIFGYVALPLLTDRQTGGWSETAAQQLDEQRQVELIEPDREELVKRLQALQQRAVELMNVLLRVPPDAQLPEESSLPPAVEAVMSEVCELVTRNLPGWAFYFEMPPGRVFSPAELQRLLHPRLQRLTQVILHLRQLPGEEAAVAAA